MRPRTVGGHQITSFTVLGQVLRTRVALLQPDPNLSGLGQSTCSHKASTPLKSMLLELAPTSSSMNHQTTAS